MKTKPQAETHNGSQGEHDSELARALELYLADLEAGGRPDPRQLIDQHPALADRLRACLTSLQFVSQAAHEVTGDGRQPAVYMGDAPDAGVLGDFRIVREVGRGGMGVVYEAQQVSLSRRVALKILPFAAVVDPRQVARFKNEAQAAAQLDHPHIVDVIAIGCERGVH
ncbi:MAG TPA: protein kinase, partial [Pirellulales bacterium]|nr:protein kinase [Pirellulales bacterium]